MENLITLYTDFINESADSKLNFQDFAVKRLEGASKIASTAKEKGGVAMLTYHHFVVKLPYYKKASAGKFNQAETEKLLSEKILELNKLRENGIKMRQVNFQKLLGIIEVLGELLIKYESGNK